MIYKPLELLSEVWLTSLYHIRSFSFPLSPTEGRSLWGFPVSQVMCWEEKIGILGGNAKPQLLHSTPQALRMDPETAHPPGHGM